MAGTFWPLGGFKQCSGVSSLPPMDKCVEGEKISFSWCFEPHNWLLFWRRWSGLQERHGRISQATHGFKFCREIRSIHVAFRVWDPVEMTCLPSLLYWIHLKQHSSFRKLTAIRCSLPLTNMHKATEEIRTLALLSEICNVLRGAITWLHLLQLKPTEP